MTAVADVPLVVGAGVPDHEDFLTDGMRLVQVLRVGMRSVEAEDAKTGEVIRIPFGSLPDWRVVRWRHGVA